jgi:hypothetical protein
MRSSKYRFKEYTFSQLKDSVSIPQFQRSLVWKKEQKEKFIDSALDGNPFGVLLLHDDIISKKLIIIDGLQRFTTLRSFYEDPFQYRSITCDDHPELKKVVEIILVEYTDSTTEHVNKQIDEIILEVIKNNKDQLHRNSIFEDNVLKNIEKIYPLLENTQSGYQIYRHLVAFWTKFKDEISIEYLNVPAIIFDGDTSELPEIFQKLNTGGTKLTKYEVFSSSWNSILLHNVSAKIAKEVERKYQALIDKTELSIENYVEGEIEAKRSVTLYEYAYAIGKIITKNSDQLMGKTSVKYDNTESIGFSALTTFLGLHLKDVKDLNIYINEKTKSSNLSKFTSTIETCFSEVEKILSPFIMNCTKYIESQVLSIVYTWFRIHYTLDIHTLEVTDNSVIKDYENRFVQHMPYRFLFDILRNYWAGSGDGKLFDVVTSDLENNRYLTPVNRDMMELQLMDWVANQSKKPSKTISADTKLVMSFILSSYQDNFYKQESIATYVIPKDYIPKSNNNVPMGHIGNVFFLDKEYSEYKNSFLFNTKVPIKHYYFYPQLNELPLDLKNITYEEYISFIERRAKTLIIDLIEQMY